MPASLESASTSGRARLPIADSPSHTLAHFLASPPASARTGSGGKAASRAQDLLAPPVAAIERADGQRLGVSREE